jgi:hypothetical protein
MSSKRKTVISYKFQNSIQTFAMYKECAFISAFAGFLIFGIASANGFRKKSFFRFNFCDFFPLFQAITEIVQFLGNPDSLEKSGQIISFKYQTYGWKGTILSKEIDSKIYQEKIVTLFIHQNNVMTFEMIFDIPQINNLFDLLGRILFCTLCLKDIEVEILIAASKTCPETIVNLKQDYDFARNFLTSFFAKNPKTEEIRKAPLIELLRYYNDLIVIVQKLLRLSKK